MTKMKHPTGEEVWGPGDWWQRRINKKKINKHLGQHGHYLPGENPEKTYRVQIVSDIKSKRWLLGSYILGVLLVKIIYDSWFFALVWPACLIFRILAKII